MASPTQTNPIEDEYVEMTGWTPESQLTSVYVTVFKTCPPCFPRQNHFAPNIHFPIVLVSY